MTRSPCATPRSSERLHFLLELEIRDPVLHARHRTVVDDRSVGSAAGDHMPIDGIVAGIADGIRKPASIGAERRVENTLWRFEPVDCAGGIAPESFRVPAPVCVGFVIAARPLVRRPLRPVICHGVNVSSAPVIGLIDIAVLARRCAAVSDNFRRGHSHPAMIISQLCTAARSFQEPTRSRTGLLAERSRRNRAFPTGTVSAGRGVLSRRG
jgi:hypothetical protein